MKKIFYLQLIVLSFLINEYGFAQAGQEWASRYNGTGNGNDYAISIAVDGSGNVYVTGSSLGAGTNSDYATIKYNSSGIQQWAVRYNGPGNGNDIPFCLAIDGSGNVYVTGSSLGSGPGNDYATVKYNSSGIQQWAQRYNGTGNDEDAAISVALDASGNVYVTGQSTGSGTSSDYTTVKYNSAGVQQWAARYHGPVVNGNDFASSLAVDAAGNIYVTGQSAGSGTAFDYATIKYNSTGIQQWVARYNGPGNGSDIARSVAVDGSGNIYVTGQSPVSGTNDDFATIKYNPAGVQQWVQRYNGPGNSFDRGVAVAVDAVGNVYMTGNSVGTAYPDYDYATIKYNSSGVQQWLQRYNGPGNNEDAPYSLALDGSGNVYVTGLSVPSGTDYDYATIRYNTNGPQQWVQRYNGPLNSFDVARSIAVDSSGNVYVTGNSMGSGTGYDYATIKYSQTVGILQTSNQIPETFRLAQNYPNPFNPITKIRFDIPSNIRGQSSNVKLAVYDILGRETAVLVNEQLRPGSYETEFDGNKFTSGVYYYMLITGEFTEVRKMILVK